MSFSNYLENKLLDHAFLGSAFTQPTALYVALFTGAAGEDGTTNEVTGTGYARKQHLTWNGASLGTVSNNGAITFAAAGAGGWGTVVEFGIFDTIAAGNYYGGGSLTASKAIAAGDVAEFATGQLTITLD